MEINNIPSQQEKTYNSTTPSILLISFLCLMILFGIYALDKYVINKTNEYTVSFYDADNTLVEEQTLEEGEIIAFPSEINGCSVTYWLDESSRFVTETDIAASVNTSYTAWYALNNSPIHASYIEPDENGLFGYGETLTKGDAAKLLCKVVNFPAVDCEVVYSDLHDTRSYYDSVCTLLSLNLMAGDPDGRFHASRNITLGEFLNLLYMVFKPEGVAELSYSDVPEDSEYYPAVCAAVSNGWLRNPETESIGIDESLTKEEAVYILNRVLGRKPDKESILEINNYIHYYKDVKASRWAFYEIMEATIPHTYSKENNTEKWSEWTLPAFNLEPGSHETDGKMLLVGEDGTYITESGFQTVAGKTYYLEEDGQVKHSLADDYDTRVFELDGKMYGYREDGSLYIDEYDGYLYFGPDGSYTCGDEETDQLIYDFIQPFLDDDSLTQEEKFHSAYNAIFDMGTKLSYLNPHSLNPDLSMTGIAKFFAKNHMGNCIYFSSFTTLIARRIGYQAYCQRGLSGSSLHVWTVFNWPDGNQYICDSMQEWALRWMDYYESMSNHGRFNCYMLPIDSDTYFWGELTPLSEPDVLFADDEYNAREITNTDYYSDWEYDYTYSYDTYYSYADSSESSSGTSTSSEDDESEGGESGDGESGGGESGGGESGGGESGGGESGGGESGGGESGGGESGGGESGGGESGGGESGGGESGGGESGGGESGGGESGGGESGGGESGGGESGGGEPDPSLPE